MACNTKKNVIAQLLYLGIIDNKNRLNPKKMILFQELRKSYLETASQYGIKNTDIFSVKKHETKEGTTYELTFSDSFFTEMDNHLDRTSTNNSKVSSTDETIDFTEHSFFTKNPSLTPSYETAIRHKRNLLNRAKRRLKSLRGALKLESDSDKIQDIKREIEDLENRISGNAAENIEGLETEIHFLESSPSIKRVMFYAEREIERLDKLIQIGDETSLKEAKEIIEFYESAGNFDSTKDNVLFSSEDIYYSSKNINTGVGVKIGDSRLPADVINGLNAIKDQVIQRKNNIDVLEKERVMAAINGHHNTDKLTNGEGFIYDEIFYKENGLKDATWFDMFTMDITNGVFSHNGVVPGFSRSYLGSVMAEASAYAVPIKEAIDLLGPDLEKALIAKGFTLKAFGIKGNSPDFSVFMSKSESGLLRDAVVTRYTGEYQNLITGIEQQFKKILGNALKTKKGQTRAATINMAYQGRKASLKKHTTVLDIRKLSAIANDPLFAEFKHLFTPDTNYDKSILAQLQGSTHAFNEEIAKIKENLIQYQNKLIALQNDLMISEDVSVIEDLSLESRDSITFFKQTNSPFSFLENYYDNKVHHSSTGNEVNENITHINFIPKSSNSFDKNFQVIESDKSLKAFHDIIMATIEKAEETLTDEDLAKHNLNSLGQAKKGFIETLSAPGLSIMQRLSLFFKELYSWLKMSLGENIESSLSYANINTVTGLPEYEISNNFYRSNKAKIDKIVSIELVKLKASLGLGILDATVDKQGKTRLNSSIASLNKAALDILSLYLSVPATASAISTALGILPNQQVNMEEILTEAVTHNIMQTNSMDLPKVIKLLINNLAEYEARQKALPLLELLKNHYENIKSPVTNSLGNTIINKIAGNGEDSEDIHESRKKGERTKAIKQNESWFERAVLGNYQSKSEFGDTKFKNRLEDETTDLADKHQVYSFRDRMISLKTGKVYTSEDRDLKNKLVDIGKELDSYKGGSMTKAEAMRLVNLENIYSNIENNLGKQMSFKAFTDNIFRFIRLKALGWNLSSGTTNFLEGQIANTIIASSGKYFPPENIYKANNMSGGSIVKFFTAGKVTTNTSALLRVLMDRYDILQDSSNELQKANKKSQFSSIQKLGPMEITQRIEYLNQSPLMLAMLFENKVLDEDGKNEVNVWEALNPDGSLKTKYDTDANRENWVEAKGPEYKAYKEKVVKVIVETHGDYDELRGSMANETITGKAVIMFKKWMARQIYQRFHIEQMDLETGIDKSIGRYHSHTKMSGALLGATVGFAGIGILGTGLVGLGVGAGIGAGIAAMWGQKTATTVSGMKELTIVSKELFKNFLRFPVNNVMGKEVITNMDLGVLGLDNRHEENLKANITELSINLAWIGLLIFTKGMYNSDDDDEKNKGLHKYLVNKLMQLSSQGTQFINPMTWKDSLGELALLRFFNDVHKTLDLFGGVINGEDTNIKTGKSKFLRQARKTFLPAPIKDNMLGFESQTKVQFEASPFDDFLQDVNVSSKKKVSRLRSAYRHELKEKYPEKIPSEISKLVAKKYRAKAGKKESWEELLKEYEKLK